MGGARAGGYAPGRARREEIITAATELFARIGYRNATVLEIAQEAGISRTGLLHHFPSKEVLLEAVLARRDAQDAERLRPAKDDATGLSYLRALVELTRHNTRIPHLIGLFAVLSAEAADPGHPAHDYFVARYDDARRDNQQALEQAGRAGLLRPGVDPAREARAVVALMDGLQVQWLLAPRTIRMADELRMKLEQILTVPL